MPNNNCGWTPGPWTVVEIEKASQIFLCAGHVPPGREAEIRANAQLASAAPDLYAACFFVEEFLLKLEGEETDDMLYRMRQHFHAPLHAVLRPALAKARGEKPDAK